MIYDLRLAFGEHTLYFMSICMPVVSDHEGISWKLTCGLDSFFTTVTVNSPRLMPLVDILSLNRVLSNYVQFFAESSC